MRVPFLASLVAFALLACSVEAETFAPTESPATPDPESEEESGGEDAGSPQKDAGTRDAGPTKKDAGKDGKAPTPPPDPFPTGLDTSCGYGPVVSPDGNAVVYEHCTGAPSVSTPRSLVHRNLVTGTSTVLSTTTSSWWREARPEGLFYNNGTIHLVGWDGVEKAALPANTYVDESSASRLRITGSKVRWARTESVGTTSSTHDERFVIYSSDSATPIVTGNFAATYITVPNVLFSEDLGLVASLERYSSGLNSRLRVAAATAGATVKTYEMSTIFEPRWVKNGVVGNGAIFVSQRKLYHANFTTGAITTLSTTPVAANTQQPDRVYAIASGGRYVFFAEGAVRENGTGAPGSFTIKKWDSQSPATASTTVATGTDYLNPYADAPMRLSPNGAWLLANFEPPGVIAGASWHSVPVAGGTDRVFAKNHDVRLYPPATAAWTDYTDGTHVEALDQSKSRVFPKSSSGYQTAFVGQGGQSIFLFTVVSNSTAKTSAWKIERTGFTGTSTTLLDLPASSRLYNGSAYDAVPALGTGLLVPVPSAAQDGTKALVLAQ